MVRANRQCTGHVYFLASLEGGTCAILLCCSIATGFQYTIVNFTNMLHYRNLTDFEVARLHRSKINHVPADTVCKFSAFL